MEPFQNGDGAATPEELPRTPNVWNGKIRQNDLNSGPKATICPKELLQR